MAGFSRCLVFQTFSTGLLIQTVFIKVMIGFSRLSNGLLFQPVLIKTMAGCLPDGVVRDG